MIVNEIETKFFAQSKAMVKFLGDTKGLVWDHQAEATKCIREHFNDATKPRIALCVLPTGSGKSGIAVLSAYACGAERVLIITPSKHISKQMYDSFYDDKGQSFLVKRSVVTLDNFIKKVRPSCVGIIKDTININSYFNHELIVANAQKFGTKSRVSIKDIPNDAVDFVIVDEAHHYPAETWRAIVDHFPCNKLFLTATPRTGKNEDILVNQSESICYQVSREVLVDRGIIRPVEFKEDSESLNYLTACRAIAIKVKEILSKHDADDPLNIHQAMVICQTIQDLNSVREFVGVYNQNASELEKCCEYISETNQEVLKRFKTFQFRTLVICGSLLEGFDHPNVSVVAIARNVQSPIIFSQFIGRSFRKLNNRDPVKACIVSDKFFNQYHMWEKFDTLADIENLYEDDDDTNSSFMTVNSLGRNDITGNVPLEGNREEILERAFNLNFQRE